VVDHGVTGAVELRGAGAQSGGNSFAVESDAVAFERMSIGG